jgi:hypothetical protein
MEGTMIHTIVAAGVGYVAGAFTPGVLRKIKALFVKETTAVATTVKTDVAAAVKKV